MSDHEPHRPMQPEFDPFPLDIPDPSPAPAFLSHVGRLDDGDVCRDGQALADTFGAPVFVPARWPEDADPLTYVCAVSPLTGSSHTGYRVYASRASGEAVVLVTGFFGEPPYGALSRGWSAPPELASSGGMVTVSEGSVDGFVRQRGQTIFLSGYPSRSALIEAALSLQEYVPRYP